MGAAAVLGGMALSLGAPQSSPGAPRAAGRGPLIALTGPINQAVTGFELVTITEQGKDPTEVAPAVGGPRMSDFVFAWSPDGRSIAYPCGKSADDPHYQVCVVRVSTGETRRLTDSSSMKVEPFAWGKNGQIASDCNGRDLCFVNASTGRVRFITRAGPSARDGYVFGNDVVWSPDGRTLAFTCRRNDQQDRRFCFVGPNGKIAVQPRSWNSVNLEGWTPDSKKIVWWGRFSGNQPLAYHEQNVDGSDLQPLPANARVIGPHYRPDGRWRLVTRGNRPGFGEEPVRGGAIRMILPTFSPWEYAFQP